MTQQSVVQDVGSLIDKLADKLAVPASQLWAVLVQQAHVEGVKATVWIIACIALLVWTWRIATPKMREAWTEQNDEGPVVAWTVLTVAGYGLGLVIGALNLNIALDAFLNPQYVAMRMILDALK